MRMKTMMMTTTLVIISLMITTTHGGGTTQTAGVTGLVQSTCKNTPNYNLCVQVLSADRRSGSPKADVSTLAIIVVDAVKAESEEAADKIEELRRRRDLKAALEKCDFEYNKVILGAVLAEAYEALTKGNPKFAEDAMVGTASSVQSCQEAFGGGAASSPLASINARVHDLSVVARAIIRNLL